ncbi:hypothetical protein GCM10027063_36780 [Promicromonospora xylanilytica]
MAQSDLQRLAEALVTELDQGIGADQRTLFHWIDECARWRDTLILAGPNDPYIRTAAEGVGAARSELLRAVQQLRRAQLLGVAWSEQAVTDVAAGKPVAGTLTPAMAEYWRNGGRSWAPTHLQTEIDDLDPISDDLQRAIDKLTPAEEERWQRVWRRFPKGGTSAQKAAFYRAAADEPDVPEYMRPVLRGSAFNHEVYTLYPASEVTINNLADDGTTKRQFRVDALSRREVVSLKYTQLALVKAETARGYVDELLKKYRPGRPDLIVASTTGNQTKLGRLRSLIGQPLAGDMVLGVPPQVEPIPRWLVDYAAKNDIEIREFKTPEARGDSA